MWQSNSQVNPMPPCTCMLFLEQCWNACVALMRAAAAARISATQAFQHCAKNNIQVHGGMGFTWEFDCHMYYRRANALALGLGSLSYWEDALIDRMRKRNAA